MDGDYSLILRLDEDFKNGLGIINPFISGLRTQNFVRLCRLWIDKLIHCAPHERKIRNIYLEQLCRHAEQQVLGPPFNCPPSEGPLQVIPQQFLLRAGVVCRRQSRTEAETTSWSDVSDTSCLTSTTIFQEDDYDDDEHDEEVKQIRKVVSTTSTTGAETTVSGSARSARFKRRNKGNGVFVKTKSKRTLKKVQNLQDSNEDLPFKDCYETPVRPKSAVSKRKGKIKRTVITDMVVKSNEDPEENCASTKKKTFKSKEAVLIDSRKDVRAESEKALIEVYSKKTVADKDKISEFESKIKDLQKELEDLRDQNDSLRNQLREERNNRDDMAVQQESLKTEVLSLREKLTVIENLKHSIEEEHNLIVNESLAKISTRVDDAISKNEKLESILVSLGNEMKRRDTIKAENFQKIQKVFCEQLKALEQDYTDKMKNSHAQTVQTYEASMSELRKELSKRNKEISRLEKQLQEQCSRMRTEVGSIKQEIEKSSKESEARLNMKINVYKAKIIKLIKYVRKVTEFYEQKIETLQKSKDMEKLNIGSDASSGKKQELEDIISALEEKFRKQLSDATKLNFHQKEQTLKLKEMSAELDNGSVNRDVQE